MIAVINPKKRLYRSNLWTRPTLYLASHYTDAYLQRFHAATLSDTPHRRRRIIVAANGKAAIVGILKTGMRHIDAGPPLKAAVVHPHVDPCMAFRMVTGAGVNIPRYVTRRDALY